ncbi:hypothetical protein OGATHE_001518, partial [Ogataea polymorpha]
AKAVSALREKQKELINSLDLDRYDISEHGWDKKQLNKAAKNKGVVSVKSDKKRKTGESAGEIYEQEIKKQKAHKPQKSKR